MKSRVQKNAELHQTLSMDFESETPSKDLSLFANKLNEIDNQFRKVEVMDTNNHSPKRARQHDLQHDAEEPQLFDTFENTYLKDFLNEVKEYNVKKGYRKVEDTQSNIVSELTGRPISIVEEIRSAIEDANYEEDDSAAELESTRVFKAESFEDSLDSVISSLGNTSLQPKTLEQTIEMNLLNDDSEPVLEEVPVLEVPRVEISEDHEDAVNLSETNVPTAELLEVTTVENTKLADMDSQIDDAFKRELLEQTQTLQHKIIEQERHIEDMNDVMVHTNRLINSVISLLLLAIFVVVILAVTYLLR